MAYGQSDTCTHTVLLKVVKVLLLKKSFLIGMSVSGLIYFFHLSLETSILRPLVMFLFK